jgi:lipoprotein Spr
MVKQVLPALGFLIALSSCSSFRPLNFTSSKQVVTPIADPVSRSKFIENINVTPVVGIDKAEVKPVSQVTVLSSGGSNIVGTPVVSPELSTVNDIMAARPAEVEAASATQLKYAVLLNMEVESLPSKPLLEAVDEWYGVRYRSGGNTKTGVDCSGFTLAVYSAVYGMMIPRVSREQYRISRKISTTELKEGDLVFFNTTGRGVSHVGVYLGNNKFIHASVSRGVMVNDLFENYYLKRFVGAGRIDDKQTVAAD